MTTDRKRQANRTNGRLSRGARTSHGRARSAKNAFRHGLSLPVHFDPALSEEVKILAHKIAGPGANAEVQELALRVAEAQVDLRRVRDARDRLLSNKLNDPYCDTKNNMRKKMAFLRYLLSPRAPDIPIDVITKVLTSTPQGPFKFAIILSQNLPQLLAMNRYEQRALSRRKFAIRAFDAMRRKPAKLGEWAINERRSSAVEGSLP